MEAIKSYGWRVEMFVMQNTIKLLIAIAFDRFRSKL